MKSRHFRMNGKWVSAAEFGEQVSDLIEKGWALTPPDPTDTETLAEVLAAHQWHHTRDTHCACGFRTPLAQLAVEGYIAHVAALIEAHFTARIVQARAGEGALRGRIEALAADLQQDIEDRREDTPNDDGSWPITRAEWVGHIAGLGDALTQLRAALTASDVPSDGPASVPDADTADPS